MEGVIRLSVTSVLQVKLAENEVELNRALRLRYEVFVEEEGNAQLHSSDRLESDDYDLFCDHLLVFDGTPEHVVGTYRLLPGIRAMNHIGFYSETEFSLNQSNVARAEILELGRSCVHPRYRDGQVIQKLWEGIAAYIQNKPFRYLIGCASLPHHLLSNLNQIYSLLVHNQVITFEYGVSPLPTHRIPELTIEPLRINERELFRKLPPLLKGYQWLGAKIAGEPAFDPIFQTIDFLIVLDKEKISQRYRKKFITARDEHV